MNKLFMKHIEYELNEKKAFCEANTAYKKRHCNVTEDTDTLAVLETFYNTIDVNCEIITSKSDFNSFYKSLDSYSINDIFADNWEDFLFRNPNLKIRDVVTSEVAKAIRCQDPKFGCANYHCEECDKYFSVPFTCKSRFCTSCGIKYQMDRAINISEKLLDCKHRHVVFTIPEELRIYFRNIPKLRNLLFNAVEDTILYYFKQINQSKEFVPGFIMVLHTFGRSLQWNPHLHVLVTEGGSSKTSSLSNDVWRSVTYFNYESLRKSFQKTLLDHMKNTLKLLLSKKDFLKFKLLVDDIYQNYQNGFYVRANPDYRDGKATVKYLIRYFNRPAMASSHILSYDGTYVVYYYIRHEDNLYVIKKVHIDDFIKMLIIHIPEKNFKMLRYAGIYSAHSSINKDTLQKKFTSLCISIMRQKANWRDRIISNFNRDPLICPHCQKKLNFFDYYIATRTI